MMIFEICELFVEAGDVECEVYDFVTEETIFRGLFSEMDYEIQNLEVMSIDNLYCGNSVLTFNVETE